jgi:hypothetical protein
MKKKDLFAFALAAVCAAALFIPACRIQGESEDDPQSRPKPPAGKLPAAVGGETQFIQNEDGTLDEIHTFTYDAEAGGAYTDYTFEFITPPAAPVEARVLIVAGGGGGGGTYDSQLAGGGGAGGVIYKESYELPNEAIAVRVGNGGAKGLTSSDNSLPEDGQDGNKSLFGVLTALGGGGGGRDRASSHTAGHAGGSGGGGAWRDVSGGASQYWTGSAAEASTGAETDPISDTRQGHKGGDAAGGGSSGGGGGGAGAAGAQGVADGNSNGGTGVELDISGEPVYYAGGGGAGPAGVNGQGDTGGGGRGSAGSNEGRHPAEDGKAGIVIVRFAAQ